MHFENTPHGATLWLAVLRAEFGVTSRVYMSRILVIDDDDELRRFFRLALTSHHFEVIEAPGGLAGVKLARSDHPDLILCDVNMRQVDGYSAISVLRLHPSTAGIPLILITGNADLDGMRKAMALGADDYLAKPIKTSDLIAAINIRLEKQKAIRESADQRANELRANLLSMMPLELLTPLSGLLGIAQVMKADANKLTAGEIQEFGSHLEESGRRMHRVVQTFLTCMEIELIAQNPAKLNSERTRERTQLGSILESVAKELAGFHGRARDLLIDSTGSQVAVSAYFLKKICEELIGNAFKFSKAGTGIRIRTESREGSVSVIIEDKGIGMTAAHIAQVSASVQFDHRLHEQQGLGLGLFIASRLLELHDGQLLIESEPGIGTSVRFEMPRSNPI